MRFEAWMIFLGICVCLFAVFLFRVFRATPLQRAIQARERGSLDEAKEWAALAIESAPDEFERSDALGELGQLHRMTGAHQEAIDCYRRALLLRQQILPASDQNIGASFNNLGHAQMCAGHVREAEKNLRHGTEIVLADPAAEKQLIARSVTTLGLACAFVGKLEESATLNAEAVILTRKEFGDDHARTAEAYQNQGTAAGLAGQFALAMRALRAAHSCFASVNGERHVTTQTAMLLQGQLLTSWSRLKADATALDRADGLLNSVCKGLTDEVGPDSHLTGTSLAAWSRVRCLQLQPTEAVQLATQSLQCCEARLGADNPTVIYTRWALAEAFAEAGRTSEARDHALRALSATEKAYGPEHFEVGGMLETLGRIAHREGKHHEAEEFLRRCLTLREPLGPQHPLRAFALRELALVFQSLGRGDEAAACRHEEEMIVAAAK